MDEIIYSDIENLVHINASETRTLEFKKQLNLETREEKSEFVADVSSFANEWGGDIIFGIKEWKEDERSIAIDISPFEIGNVWSLPLLISQLVQDSTEPRLQCEVRVISSDKEKWLNVVVVRVQKSWNAPHRVKSTSEWYRDRFYARTQEGKYQMDVSQLRKAFLFSSLASEAVDSFIEDRIHKVCSSTKNTPVVLIHFVPLEAFSGNSNFDFEKAANIAENWSSPLFPLFSSSYNQGYNSAWFFTLASWPAGSPGSWAQLFHNGAVEFLGMREESGSSKFAIVGYEQRIIELTDKVLENLLELSSVACPISIRITLLNYQEKYINDDQKTLKDRMFRLPETIVMNYETIHDRKTDMILRPAFDVLWNGFGYPKSLSYLEEWRWSSKTRYWL